MSEIGEIIVDMDNNDNMENSDAPAEEPTILHTKKFRIGSGNIIGKGVIQDFFTCAGALPSMGCSILHRTSSLADAITMLVVELERKFMHMHPCIQRVDRTEICVDNFFHYKTLNSTDFYAWTIIWILYLYKLFFKIV